MSSGKLSTHTGMKVLTCRDIKVAYSFKQVTNYIHRRATEDSILAIQIFDQKKFKKKDQGFLGVINVRIGDVVDFSSGHEGE